MKNIYNVQWCRAFPYMEITVNDVRDDPDPDLTCQLLYKMIRCLYLTCSLLRPLTGEATFNFCNRAREAYPILPRVPFPFPSESVAGFGSFDPLLCLTVKPQPFIRPLPATLPRSPRYFVATFPARLRQWPRVRSCASIAVDNRHELGTESEPPIRN